MTATKLDRPTTLKRPRISVAAQQYEQLSNLAAIATASSPLVAKYLSDELERARIIEPGRLGAHVVQIDSTVTYREQRSDAPREVTLVYPGNADIGQGKISILTPVGAALIGMSAGQTISYPAPDGQIHELTVLRVVNLIRSEDGAMRRDNDLDPQLAQEGPGAP